MSAPRVQGECPFCHTRLSPEVAPSYRPFSCPSCHLLIQPRPYYQRYGTLGCLTVCAICLLGPLVFGLRWYLGLIGIAVGVFIIAKGLHFAAGVWPQPPALVPYTLQTYPENLPPFSEFLDQIAAASAWRDEFDSQLVGAKGRRTYDDELENVAIELAERYRSILRGVPPRKGRVKRSFDLEELRAELRAIARDIRLAAKS